MQVKEGQAVAVEVEVSAALFPSSVVAIVVEERAIMGMIAPQAPLEPPAGTGSGGEDVVMVSVDNGSAPPPPTRERDVATSLAL
jgi:hypothetical protein